MALLALVVACTPPAPASADVPLRIAVVGDSISCGGMPDTPGWCPELSRLLTAAGVEHELLPLAVGGTRCQYWADHIGGVLTTYQPDLVILGCGTNDGGAQLPDFEVKAAVESVAAQVQTAGARLLAGIPSYSSGAPTERPLLPVWQDTAYQGIRDAFDVFGGTWFSPAMFDDTRMPALSKFVLGDGVHPTSRAATTPLTPMTLRGYDVLAHNRYRALLSFIPGMPGIPPDCMQIGHPPGEPIPASFPCYGRPY